MKPLFSLLRSCFPEKINKVSIWRQFCDIYELTQDVCKACVAKMTLQSCINHSPGTKTAISSVNWWYKLDSFLNVNFVQKWRTNKKNKHTHTHFLLKKTKCWIPLPVQQFISDYNFYWLKYKSYVSPMYCYIQCCGTSAKQVLVYVTAAVNIVPLATSTSSSLFCGQSDKKKTTTPKQPKTRQLIVLQRCYRFTSDPGDSFRTRSIYNPESEKVGDGMENAKTNKPKGVVWKFDSPCTIQKTHDWMFYFVNWIHLWKYRHPWRTCRVLAARTQCKPLCQ